MFTNFHGNMFPDGCVGTRPISEVMRKMCTSEGGENIWHTHVICTEGETDIEDICEDEALEQHMHGVQLWS